MTRSLWPLSALLGLWPTLGFAQSNGELTPYQDVRVGGSLLFTQGRGSPNEDNDLLVARERFRAGDALQSLYLRTFDGSNDLDRVLVQVDLLGAVFGPIVTDLFGLVVLTDNDFRIGSASDYGQIFEFSRGLEGGDSVQTNAGNTSALVTMITNTGIDDLRMGISYPDLDPGALVNRGNASVLLSLFAGGATAPLNPGAQSGSTIGFQVGGAGVLDDGDFVFAGREPEGVGGLASPPTVHTITLRLLFEDLDLVDDSLDFGTVEVGQSSVSQAVVVDNYAQGSDLDGDNLPDDENNDVPNLPLLNVKLNASDLQRQGGGGVISSAAVQGAFALGGVELFADASVATQIAVPLDAVPGLYTGTITAWEDNDNDNTIDASETSDTVEITINVIPIIIPDSDNDGLPDATEDANENGVVDPGETNPNDADSDDDGLQDGVEVLGPNPTNPLDADSDNDELLDGIEDANQNGQFNAGETNPNDPDTDDGGEPDGSEVDGGRNPLNPNDDVVIDPNADPDNDGLSNAIEDALGTNFLDPDSDNDGLKDGEEDADHNGVRGATETNALDADSDDDGLKDGTEVLGDNRTNPLIDDTDEDGLPDGCEDSNQNGALNANETDPNERDSDDDGLPDGNEDSDGSCSGFADPGETDPLDADSDDGGEPDGSEVLGGRDPLEPSDDIRPASGLFRVRGGACAVQPSAAIPAWWSLLLVACWVLRRRR